SVIAASAQATDRAHRVATASVGDQPFACRARGERSCELHPECDRRHPPNLSQRNGRRARVRWRRWTGIEPAVAGSLRPPALKAGEPTRYPDTSGSEGSGYGEGCVSTATTAPLPEWSGALPS